MAGEIVIEITAVQFEQAHRFCCFSVIIIMIHIIRIEKYPFAVLVVPDFHNFMDYDIDNPGLPSVGHAHTTNDIVKVDTHALSILEVTKRVSEIIHLNEYRQCDIHKRLEEFKEDEVRVEI